MDAGETTLELPNGDVIEPGDVILFEGYPYRYVDRDDGFVLSPLYWGESDLDLWFESPADLEDRWGPESRGVLAEAEWRAWLDEARSSPTFSDAELESIADEVLPRRGLLGRIRRLFARI